MIPAEFEYLRADSLEQAIAMLGDNPGAKLLAGGHSLLPMMKLRLAQPPTLIDVGRLTELRGVELRGDRIHIGALTSHSEVASSELVRGHIPVLADAAGKIADPAVRNKGTLGGNLAHADPASDLPAVLVALGAVIHLAGPTGERQVYASSFFVGLLHTALHEQEVLTAVSIHKNASRDGTAYLKCEHPASGFALCGAVAVARWGTDGTFSGIRLCFNGVSPTPLDAVDVASRLVGTRLDDEALSAALEELSIEDPMSDIHASAEYRLQLARTYGKRSLQAARDAA